MSCWRCLIDKTDVLHDTVAVARWEEAMIFSRMKKTRTKGTLFTCDTFGLPAKDLFFKATLT